MAVVVVNEVHRHRCEVYRHKLEVRQRRYRLCNNFLYREINVVLALTIPWKKQQRQKM